MPKEPTPAVESPRQPSAPESRRESLGSVRSPARTRLSGGSFASTISLDHSRDSIEAVSVDGNGGEANKETSPKKGPRKSLPGARRVPLPSTPITTSFSAQEDKLPEINKAVLSVKHDGVVFTDPPIMRGVPLAKISPDHPYWEPSWPKIEDLVEPLRQKHQEKYNQLDQSGSTHRDKHLANRDAKRGRMILKFLKDGELHPYQLVGKEWINTRITNYDTLFRLVQLLTEELPKMNLDVTPSEWVRHRLYEQYLEKGHKFDVALWIGKAYHDPKVEQLRTRNGFARVGRPPAYVTKSANGESGGGSTAKKTTAARSLKRKDPHQTPDATPTRARAAVGSGTSAEQESRPTIAESTSGQSAAPAPNGEGQRAKKIKIKDNDQVDNPEEEEATSDIGSTLDYDGYTSSDSISGDRLMENEWQLHQVRTRSKGTNPRVTQYWHWDNASGPNQRVVIEHQVLEDVEPSKWSVFKKPCNFHLKPADIKEVSHALGCTKIVVTHMKGKDGRDVGPRGDVMAQFRRDRTKRRFLKFLVREMGVRVVTRNVEAIEATWNSIDPEILPGPDSD
ncbi:hypothetical protein B0J18DRAFT_404018 [Chaetomium sp. MPI-SDFR-AT-0129]|nr:hypothetical protein B0J18DRAFT_404018 [Chaetomium sp. MPI-SDFR-AT-0129]